MTPLRKLLLDFTIDRTLVFKAEFNGWPNQLLLLGRGSFMLALELGLSYLKMIFAFGHISGVNSKHARTYRLLTEGMKRGRAAFPFSSLHQSLRTLIASVVFLALLAAGTGS